MNRSQNNSKVIDLDLDKSNPIKKKDFDLVSVKSCKSLPSIVQSSLQLNLNNMNKNNVSNNVNGTQYSINNNNQNIVNNVSLSFFNTLPLCSQELVKQLLISQIKLKQSQVSQQANPLSSSMVSNFSQNSQKIGINVTKDQLPINRLPPQLAQQQGKQQRIKRMNIPKTIMIDRKTREVIQTIGHRQLTLEHPEDRQIVQRVNRLLIQGQWKYSSLLGKENRRIPQMEGFQKSPRDGQFPEYLTLVSQQMRKNFQENNGIQFAHLVQSQQKVKMVHQSVSFGLTPTNSRYFVFGIFGLTKNLQPSLFGLGFANDKALQMKKDEVYYTFMKTLIESNNESLAQMRREMICKKKMLGRKIREPEVVAEDNFIFPEIFFCRTQKIMLSAVERIKAQFSLSFEAHPSFTYRYQIMNSKFVRHELKKQDFIYINDVKNK